MRRVRVMRYASNVQKILDAFQKAGWPHRIPNPLPHGPDQLRQTLYTLHEDLEVLRFSSQQGGQSVTWELR